MNLIKLLSERREIGLLAGLALIAIVGCEVGKPSDAYVTISPQQVTLRKNQSQEFVASGAVTYEWHLAYTNANATNEIWGILDTYSGERVKYTNLRTPVSMNVTIQTNVDMHTNITIQTNTNIQTFNNIQTLTVVGTIGTTTTTGTNHTEAVTLSAEAYITHRK